MDEKNYQDIMNELTGMNILKYIFPNAKEEVINNRRNVSIPVEDIENSNYFKFVGPEGDFQNSKLFRKLKERGASNLRITDFPLYNIIDEFILRPESGPMTISTLIFEIECEVDFTRIMDYINYIEKPREANIYEGCKARLWWD